MIIYAVARTVDPPTQITFVLNPDPTASTPDKSLPQPVIWSSQGLNVMLADHSPRGRMERRLPLMVAIRLEPALGVSTDGQEKTYTDNISPRGARVISRHPWQAGEIAKITSQQEGSICGQVVYCQKLPEDRYAVGLHILDRPIQWSIVERFWGT